MILNTIRSHYHILDKLGEGGMGIVYKAEDTRLKRTVALKFLPPELTRDPEAKQRFIHEAQAASTLQHTNICTIHDIDEDEDGQLFIVMDYYEGESLKEKTARGPIKLDKVLDIAIQVAGGLAKAHQKGIVHRDIKPENILITTDGIVKILDFGVAKLTNQSGITRTGSTIGTAAYMSPEQAQGLVVDHRADIWSLGVVLYEMLTGRLPFRDEYEAALLYSIVHEEYPGIPGLRSDIPPGVVSLIDKSLQKDRSHRYQTTVEMIKDLKSAMEPVAASSNHEKSIVVLPFENLSSDPEQEYFSDGLTEEIITDLSHVHDLLVISRSSAMTLKGSKRTIPDIARQLNVQYVLEGSVRKAGNSLRITGQLIDASNDTHLWAEKYSGTLDDVFDIQEKVSQSIVSALKLAISTKANQGISLSTFRNSHAHDLYLRARPDIFLETEESLKRAISLLEEALEIEGENTVILGALGLAHFFYALAGASKIQNELAEAEHYALRVFSIDSDSVISHNLLGMILYKRKQLKDALHHWKLSLTINPNDPETLMWLSFCSSQTARPKAKEYIKRYQSVEPLSLMANILGAFADHLTGDFERAVRGYQKSLNDNPGFNFGKLVLGQSLISTGRTDDAFPILESIAKSAPKDNWANMAVLLLCSVKQDLKGFDIAFTKNLQNTIKNDETLSWLCAECHAIIGRKNKALFWLQNAVDFGFINYPFLSDLDPLLINIRDEVQFKKLMKRVKHEWEEFKF